MCHQRRGYDRQRMRKLVRVGSAFVMAKFGGDISGNSNVIIVIPVVVQFTCAINLKF